MATWQQGINSGGLLAGIGLHNDNAPRESDSHFGASLIRDNNDLIRSGANNAGLTAVNGLAGLAGAYQQYQQKQDQKAFNEAHAKSWQSGDTSALRQFAVDHPAFVQQAQQAVSGLDTQQRQDMGTQAAGLRMALSQGPQALSQYIQGNAANLQRIGADPNTLMQMAQQNPQQAQHLVDTIGMSSLGPKDYFDAVDKQQKSDIQQQNASTSSFSAQQKARQGDDRLAIDRFKAQTGADLQAQQLKLDAAYKKATTDTARANINLKMGQIGQAMAEKVGGVSNNIASVSSNISQIQKLGDLVNKNPSIVSGSLGFGSQGWAGGITPTVTPESREFESRRDQVLNSLLTDGSLRATFGSQITDGERETMKRSISTLQSATTPEQFNAELSRLQQRSVNAAKRQINSLGIKKTPLSSDKEAAAVNYLQKNPDMVGPFIQDHGYLPEGYWRSQVGKQ